MNSFVEPRLLKGFRDFSAAELFKREYVKKKIRAVFELYGFEPLETPVLEYLETFSGNIGEDEKLFFHFTDRGGRAVALRYDQAIPVCRYVAQNKNSLTFPYKRYQIQNAYRAENPQKGRYREFLQCDADIFGVSGREADAEVIALGLDIFKALGFQKFVVKINDRSLFKNIPYSVLASIDKLAKIGQAAVLKEIVNKGYSQTEAANFFQQIVSASPNQTILEIFTYLKNLGFSPEQYCFDPTVIRSFNYSSGPIWEVVIPEFSEGSVLGGERYDDLVGRFSSETIPATGFGLGFDRTLEAMQEFGILPELSNKTQVLVTVFSQELLGRSLELVKTLRQSKLNTEIYSRTGDKLEKQLKYSSK
jgi:histidyl-tRNA synthetase